MYAAAVPNNDPVDLSKTYLAWAQENFALNGLSDSGGHRFIHADVVHWLS